MLSFIAGMVVGGLLVWIYLDREGFRDRLLGLKDSASEHAPSQEQTASAASTAWSIIKGYWFILVVLLVLLVWGASLGYQQLTQVPQVQLGLNQFEDACGKPVIVELNIEDVRRGNFPVGSGDCQRVVQIHTAQGE